MADKLTWRRYYARGTRHDHESYGAVCDPDGGNGALAYLRVSRKREGLVYRADPAAVEVMVTQNTYVLSPILAAGYLIWVEVRRDSWTIRALGTSNVATGRIIEPISCTGRPIHLSASSFGDHTVLVWEERIGTRTRLRGVTITGEQFGQPVDMTAGVSNAYDPQCLVTHDGNVALTYTAFADRQYHVFIQFFSDALYPAGLPQRISDGDGAALYPSICERSEGGVWFSFVRVSPELSQEHVVKSFRHRAQAGLFAGTSTVAVGALHNERVYAPFAPPAGEGKQGALAAMTVFGSEGGNHSRVFEDDAGRLRLLMRQHIDRCRVTYEDDDRPLVQSRGRGAVEGLHSYSSICLASLRDQTWSEPKVLVPAAHFQAPLSMSLSGPELRFAFTEDVRHTGWNAAGEWMDGDSEVGVGAAMVTLDTSEGAPRYDMRPYVIEEVPPQGIADPVHDDEQPGEYLQAIGQTHAHSEVSVCWRATDRDAHFNYRFMQDVQHSNFGAISDHAYNMWHTEMLLMRKLAEYYYFPGEFVAIQSHEWTGSSLRACTHEGGPWGHVNPLMLEESKDLECYYPGDESCEGRSLARLCNIHRESSVIAPPHHMIDSLHPFKWGDFDEQVMPVVEVFQDFRGACEKPWAPGVSHMLHVEQGPWCDTELLSGKRFGFIAGADHGGIARAGVLTRALTREALYEAFTARRCFATTGIALTIDFSFNGEPMGSAVEASEGEFVLTVSCPDEIYAIQVVHNGQEDDQLSVRATSFQHRWTTKRRRHGEFWYCRILMTSGEIAWTSPIWID
jgi:hypothetical protein